MRSGATVVIDTGDLDEIDAFLGRTYATTPVTNRPQRPVRLHVARATLGPLSLDEVRLSYDISWRSDPLGMIRLSRVHAGVVHWGLPDGSTARYGPGDVMIMGAPERPLAGRCDHSHFDVILLDPVLLERVAAPAPSRHPEPVQFVGDRPISAAAQRQVTVAIEDLQALAARPSGGADFPLLASAAADYLAAVLLKSFPSTALLDPTIEDRRDSTPALLRRAIAFIDDNAHLSISLADIAAAIYVSPRALQYLFRKHLDCTPMDYVRRVRLHYAHQDLLASTRATTTVAQIAQRWGFHHTGRFALYYRLTYGHSPHETLRS